MERDGKKENSSKFIPDEIFLRLPIKSLLRFSSVSKSWNSSILSNALLADKYRARKALVFADGKNVSSLALSNDRNQTGDDAVTTLDSPLSKKFPIIVASCDTLLCATFGLRNLFLWNPWTGSYRKIRKPSAEGTPYICGLGYDAVANDYKMLSVNYLCSEVELYSLRRDSWRKIPPHHSYSFMSKNFVFVSGTFHWLDRSTIISFDLSKEKFGDVTGPDCPDSLKASFELAASNGKLCVCVHYPRTNRIRYVIWTMEDYGIAESWTKTFDIRVDNSPVRAVMKSIVMKSDYRTRRIDDSPVRTVSDYRLRYLHSYDDGRILIEASGKQVLILVCEGNKVVPLSNFSHKIHDCFLLVESLVSPNMY